MKQDNGNHAATPGPWTIKHQIETKGEVRCGFIAVLAGNGATSICDIFPFGARQSVSEIEASANARLIAASPSMLEALEDVATWLIAPDMNAANEMRETVCAALAKARKE